MKNTLIASSPTLERIEKLIADYYLSKNTVLSETSENKWSVSNAKGIISTVHVVKKGNRFRFERIA